MADLRKAAKSRIKPKRAKAAKRPRKGRKKRHVADEQPWVWDPSRPGFKEEIQRQMKLVANDPQEERILEEIAALADL